MSEPGPGGTCSDQLVQRGPQYSDEGGPCPQQPQVEDGVRKDSVLCRESVKVLVAQSCPTLCDSMDCSPPDSSVHGILQARILQRVAIPSPGDLPNPGVKPWSFALQVDSLPSEPPEKPLCREVDTSRPMGQPPQGLDPKTEVPPCSPPGPRARGEGLASLPLLLSPGTKARRPGVFQARVMSSGTILN